MKKVSAFTLALIVLLLGIQKSEILTESVATEVITTVEPIETITKSYDVSTLFLTFHFPANWDQNPRFIKIWNWFEMEAELVSLKSAMIFNVYEEGTEIFNEKYAEHVTVPSILIQEPTGDVVFSATANNIPKTSHELISKIKKKIPGKTQQYRNSYKKCDNINCPNCYPKAIPKPIMRPINLPEPELEPVVKKPEPDSMSYIPLLLSLLGGAGYGLYSNKDSEDNNEF